MNLGHIYLITCPTGKKYIGQTVCIRSGKIKHGYLERWKEHVRNSETHKNGCVYLENAIRKYGKDNFKIELIEEIDIDDLNEREKYWIEYHNSIVPNGYNLMTGGGVGRLQNEETKEKISKSCKGNSYIWSKNASKRERKRKEDNDLPMYIRSYYGKREEGFQVEHPLLKHKRFSFKTNTREENLLLAIEYLNTAPEHIPKPRTKEKPENFPDSRELPKYISIHHLTRNGKDYYGYTVRSHGNIKGKTFMSSKLTIEEKYQLAINYLKEQTDKLNVQRLDGSG